MTTAGRTNTTRAIAGATETKLSELEPAPAMPRVIRTAVNIASSAITTAARLEWIDMVVS
jgi:hypothetical protein